MEFSKIITAIDAHTEGEPVRLITGGIPFLPGNTMAEKRDYFKKNFDFIRTALCYEPRGHKCMFSCIMTPPISKEANFGVIFMGNTTYPDMCGHGTIGVAAMAVEMGLVDFKDPVTEVIIDTPGGTINTRVAVEKGRVQSVTLQGVPSFLLKSMVVDMPGVGKVSVDVAYGGNFFAIIEAKDIRIEAKADSITTSASLFSKLRKAIEETVEVQHPEIPFARGVTGFIINDKPHNPKANILNIACPSHARYLDRSPCGTGTCAKMATLYAKGELDLGDTYVTESVTGTLFWGKLIRATKVGEFKAVLPEVTGRAFITGFHQFVIDESDPLKYGFSI